MAVIPNHDFGTVRLFEVGDIVEAYFPKDDTVTRGVVKGMRGFFDANRRAWRVTPKNARMETGEIITAFRTALEKAAPEKWMLALPKLLSIAVTTKRYTLKLGEGGMRVELPPGHQHEYTLKHDISGAFKDGPVWLVPASICANKTVKGVIIDVVEDDRRALSDALDYLEGFVFSGQLDIVHDEIGDIGLIPRSVVFADPSFIRKADANIGPEPLHEYPLEVLAFGRAQDQPDGPYQGRFRVLTGDEAHFALRTRFAKPVSVRTKPLDNCHVAGKWSRRRG
jgi:hypothetical protein